MAKHSVSEAARLAGVSRSHFYKKYIRPGSITVERDKDDKPIIDTAEIMRVCGELKDGNSEVTQIAQLDTQAKDNKIITLQAEIDLVREQLTVALDDKKWLREKVDQLSGQLDAATRLLEHRTAPAPPKKRRWWLFS